MAAIGGKVQPLPLALAIGGEAEAEELRRRLPALALPQLQERYWMTSAALALALPFGATKSHQGQMNVAAALADGLALLLDELQRRGADVATPRTGHMSPEEQRLLQESYGGIIETSHAFAKWASGRAQLKPGASETAAPAGEA